MTLRSLTFVALALMAASATQAQLVAPQTRGTLSVDYIYESAGQETDAQQNDKRDWRVSRKVSVVAQMMAEKHSPVAALLPATAAEKKDLADRQQRAVSGAQKASPMMSDIQKVMERCGDDEACMQREAMKLAGTMDPGAMRSAGEDAAAAGRPMSNSYQMWKLVAYTGTYSADEVYNNALADPDCLSAPRSQCVSQQTRKGSGPVPPADGKASPLVAMMEVDGPGKRLHISLPLTAGKMPITRTVTGKVPDGKTGTFPDQLTVPWTRIKAVAVSIPAGLNNASGTEKIKIDGQRGESGTLLINWRFVLAR